MAQIRMLVFDIDGVITDGKRYIGQSDEMKSVSLKDLDAIRLLQESGYMVGCISGEDTEFSRELVRIARLEFAMLGCKQKAAALDGLAEKNGVCLEEICYVGDGKYDIPALRNAGFALCPADAIEEVKQVADAVLTRKGGDGCVAEIYTLLSNMNRRSESTGRTRETSVVVKRINERIAILTKLLGETKYVAPMEDAAQIIADCYRQNGRILICGSGESAADAQRLAGQLIGGTCIKRKALDVEALIDSGDDQVFARQVEAKASERDVLIGIKTGGTCKRVQWAFAKARERGAKTILMTGEMPEDAAMPGNPDCTITVPAREALQIQEMHMMIGHVICELLERKISGEE